MSAPVYAPTGTGKDRRRLTESEAMAGHLPERMTPREWDAMHRASHAPVAAPVFRFAEGDDEP